MEQTRSQRFVQKYARLMKSSAEFFNKDSVLMSKESYDKADLRLLVVFPSPASTKAVSMTAAVLNDYVISSCPGVFIDFAYVPEQDDLKYYDKENIPYAVGNITHLDASHFDIVGFSISILFESISVAWIMNSFSRCDKPIPLTWTERKDMKLSEIPMFYAGGITCSVADILFGELGDGRQAILDYLHLGEFHCSKLMFDHYLQSRLADRTVQETIDTFWKTVPFNDWVYQPQAYQVEYNDRNQIVRNIKINPNAPDMCKPYYPDEMPKEIGSARGIIMGNGVNAGLGQILAANGCSRSGFCNFSVVGTTLIGTENGPTPIQELVNKGSMRLQSTGLVSCKDIVRQSDERSYRVTLESGVYLDCSINHKWIRAIDCKIDNKEKTYTTKQVADIVRKGREFIVLRKIGNHFERDWSKDSRVSFMKDHSKLSSDGKCYQFTLNIEYLNCYEAVNTYIVHLNYYGFDTNLIKLEDSTVIEWWPMPNCVTYDRVVSVTPMNEVHNMYDVFDTDDHTVCYNGIVTHQCYAEDTLVTTDRGLVRIENLKVGDKVDGGCGSFETVTAKFDTGVQDVLKFTLDDGNELRVTFDHNLLDSEGKDKKAKDFKVGDSVYFRPHFCDSGINEDGRMLYLAGYFLGDGSYEKHNYSTRSDCGVSGVRWYFSRTSQGVSNMNLVQSVLDDLGVPYLIEDNPKNTTVRVIVRESSTIQQVLKIVGDKERLTDYVLSLNKDSFLWFMSGVIASDGTVDAKLGHIRLGMSRKELILDMYRKLQQFDMATKVDYYTYKQTASEHPRFSKYEGRVIKKWRILFNLKDNEKFSDAQIVLFGDGKRGVKKARKATTRKQVGKIVSIEVEEKVQCYNLTVEPNHKLMVQGNVCSSNCHEGAYTGGWVENTPERLVELAKLCRKNTASTTLKAYSFNCVSEDTPVITESGICRASDLTGDERVVTPSGYSPYILNRGKSDSLVNLIMSQGVNLKITPNHRQLVFTKNGIEEKFAKDIVIGDWIPFTVGTAKTVAKNSVYFALGLWYGDGNTSGNSNYFVFNDWEVENVNNILPWVSKEVESTKGDNLHVFLATKEFTALVRKVFPNGKEDVRNLYSLGLQELVDFVQGLFDADGCGSRGWLKFTQKSSRKELLNLISTVLLSLGIRTSFSREIKVNLEGYDKEYSRYDLKVVGQESRVAFLQTFNNHVGKLDLVSVEDSPQNKDKCLPPELGVYLGKEFVRVFGRIPSGFNRSKFFKGVEGITVGKFLELFSQYKHTIKIVSDIVNGMRFSCVSRIETLSGDFDVVDVCETSGGVFNVAGFWTHNSNYLSDYKRNIYDWLGVFPRVTFNNMRLEELGLDKDALKMMKLAGYQRMTAPLEGISERIRNNLLNKNLSEKALDSYLEYGMMMGAVDCKVGIVLTGFEEEEDWQAFYDFNMKWRKKCHDMGGNIPFRYKCTLLVHYPHTPVEYLERRAARHAFYGTYIMPDDWNTKFYEDHVRIKLNGFKHSTFIEQAIVDLGRSLTPWMYQYLIKPNYPIYNMRPIITHEDAWESLRAKINPDYFFNQRNFDEYISVCHRIHIAMHANVIYQAKKILKDGANATPTIRCLKTYEGCPVDCKANVYSKEPLKSYGDVWIGDGGKIDGILWEEVKGCQRCKTPEDRKKVLARNLPMSKNADDILMHKAPSLELRLRFRLERKKEFEVLNPRNTAFVFFTKFLRMSDELCKVFWELDAYHNMFWQSEEDKTYVVSGQQIVDVTFTDKKAKDLVLGLVDEVNKTSHSFRVKSVREVPLTDKIKVDDLNIFYFESTLPVEFWQYASMNYHGEVKVEGSQGMETIKDDRLKAPNFTLRDKVKGYFAVPCKYSPWHYLQALMAVRRIPLSKLLATTSIVCITTVRESNGMCLCGKEKSVTDISTNSTQKVGLSCMTSLLTSKL